MNRIILFANGALPNFDSARAILRDDDFLLGVDAGARYIFALGLKPHLIIGDLDSLNINELPNDIPIKRYPSDKDETDLELALEYAIESGYCEIIVVAALGNRLDQTLANISLIAPLSHVGRRGRDECHIRLDDGVEEIYFCREKANVNGISGDIVSLIPWGREVTGVFTENLKWPLRGETLYPTKTRGVSNEMLSEDARIKIGSGILLIVHRRQS